MSNFAWLTLYCAAVLLFSMCGGYVPLRGGVTHTRLQFYLSVSAGVMLGAAFFHVMPEAMENCKPVFWFGFWMSLGVVGLFFIERFIAPHSHEIDSGHQHSHAHEHRHRDHDEGPHAHEHGDLHAHKHLEEAHHDHRAAAPAVAGWMAVFGLTLHTLMNGVGLAGAVKASSGSSFPGWALFLAIFLHKPADALAISTVLSRKGVPRAIIFLVQIGFAVMVPLGAASFYLAQEHVEEAMQHYVTGAALAFSAGTFLFIALSDLLPEMQFHRHDRIPLFLTLVAGVAFMGGIAMLEGHDHGGDAHHGPHQKHHHDGDKDADGDEDKDVDHHGK